ncbi:YrdB family protein [Streptomyces sp. NPDC057433]|uniref:YrdB family protein n=1 Tax=Streptomyces sp. NPDC057433 TaxID=3346132 RepID=UPI0036C39C12
MSSLSRTGRVYDEGLDDEWSATVRERNIYAPDGPVLGAPSSGRGRRRGSGGGAGLDTRPWYAANEALAFLLKLAALGFLGGWGFRAGPEGALRILLGVGTPLLVVVVCALSVETRARWRPRLPLVPAYAGADIFRRGAPPTPPVPRARARIPLPGSGHPPMVPRMGSL